MSACGRDLHGTDIEALDEYMHRCKLGAFRPGRALRLEKEANSSTRSAEEKQHSADDLNNLRALARAEFGKLRQIQKNRLLRFRQEMECGLTPAAHKDTSGESSPHRFTAVAKKRPSA